MSKSSAFTEINGNGTGRVGGFDTQSEHVGGNHNRFNTV